MPSHQAAAAKDGRPLRLKGDDYRWLRQVDALFPVRPPLPRRTIDKLSKLGLIELRADRVIVTDKGRHILPCD